MWNEPSYQVSHFGDFALRRVYVNLDVMSQVLTVLLGALWTHHIAKYSIRCYQTVSVVASTSWVLRLDVYLKSDFIENLVSLVLSKTIFKFYLRSFFLTSVSQWVTIFYSAVMNTFFLSLLCTANSWETVQIQTSLNTVKCNKLNSQEMMFPVLELFFTINVFKM